MSPMNAPTLAAHLPRTRGLLPMLMGGDPASLKIAESLGAFVREPKSLTVSLKAKGAPVRFSDAPALADPSSFLDRVELNVSANR